MIDTVPQNRATHFPAAGVCGVIQPPVSTKNAVYPGRHTARLPAATPPGDKTESYGPGLVGSSDAMEKLRSQVRRIAPYFRTALITGAAGTCKEGVARMLHTLSAGSRGEFISCEASVFAAAMLRADGRALIEAATGGTLFLEDIGEVPPAMQGSLMRMWSVTERGRFRVVAGTHRNLRTMAVTGQFRQDLVQRLTGVELALPSLRNRKEDLPAVILELLRKVSGDRDMRLAESAMARLLEHPWPGDIAEAEKVLWAAMSTVEDATLIETQHLPVLRHVDAPAQSEPRMERLQDVVQQHVLGVLTRCGGNKLRAAEVLGISRSTLYRMLNSCLGDGFPEF